jgi:hypothetical protein
MAWCSASSDAACADGGAVGVDIAELVVDGHANALLF